MPETTTAPTAAAVNKATSKAGQTAAAVSETLPAVVETVELAMEVPVKVALNQKLVITISILGGAALGAGILFGVQKFTTHRAEKKNLAEFDKMVDEDMKKK